MKIAILYDSLVSKGGAERVTLQLANALNADVITSGLSPEVAAWIPIQNKIIDIGNFSMRVSRPIGILLEAPIRFFMNRNRFSYDLYIYIGFTSIYGSTPHHKNIWFCLTPNRMLYDLHNQKTTAGSFLYRLFFKLYYRLFRNWDHGVVTRNFAAIIAQTNTVKQRIRRFYDMDSTVIYSPVDTSVFHFDHVGDYYLTVGRLFPEKRIDLIARAFTKMPHEKLVIVGDGPQRDYLTHLIKGHDNIRYEQNISEERLRILYAQCKATIYLPVNEDYGLIPLEGMASGKMCIGVNEGGVAETVTDGYNGYLIEPTIAALTDTVTRLRSGIPPQMRKHGESTAQKFDIREINRLWKEVIATLKI